MAKPHLKLKVGNQAVNFKPQDLSVHIAVAKQFANGFNGWLPNPDPILKKAGKQIYAYRELLRDPLVDRVGVLEPQPVRQVPHVPRSDPGEQERQGQDALVDFFFEVDRFAPPPGRGPPFPSGTCRSVGSRTNRISDRYG